MHPSWLDSRFATPADLAACRYMLCGGSRSFYAASFLLPRRVHEPATALYAFCRFADDEIDLNHGRGDSLGRLHRRLNRVYSGCPDPAPPDRCLAAVVHHYGIPRSLMEALLEGLAWDDHDRRYETLSEVYDYSARVAGTVGVMMSLLMGVRSPELTARACDLGVAMQLTNIARDVGEDARAGRLYLPMDWLREEGIDPDAWLARPRFDAALERIVRRLLATAERLYTQADLGIAGLPRDCRAGINAARFLYAEIGQQLKRMGYDSVTRRAVVPAARKAELVPLILWTSVFPRRGAAELELSETRFLVEAAADACLPPEVLAQGSREPALAQIESRAVWVLELFERLERRDRMRRAAARQRVMEPLRG